MWKKGKQWLCGAALFLRLFRHQECW
ncbi:KxYKxGKxW signal peptide domain-containing protein [Listeria innocua]|nr:hypothetical protein [Listeria monocytogenes]EHK4067729.1 KxYKxGKxW signal peptide domain-containing protein [Listeria monocytogenes]MBC2238717.1 KxYKxGKxW signal peptide domain-containing protein [Listeria innocua]TYV33165.1 hypothetical protein FZ060_14515 [Listeria monocytogenes]